MKIAICTSVSKNTPWAHITLPNWLEYCIKHNYTMITRCESYEDAFREYRRLHDLLDIYDLVWMLDADCLITNFERKIEDIDILGPHASICEEGLGPHALVNAGSMVWKSTELSHRLVDDIVESKSEWELLPFSIQDWLMKHHLRLKDRLKICPRRTFNSVHHGDIIIWQEGDFVYHPCGMPSDIRCEALRNMTKKIIK